MTVQTATSRTGDRRRRAAPTAAACAAGSTRRRPPLFVARPVRRAAGCWCSGCPRREWPLLRGDQGINFPDNYTDAVDNRFFVDSVVFTLKYTVLATVLLIGLGLGLALLVQESSRWKGLLRTSFLVPSALGLASASLLFYVLYSPLAGPLAPLHGAHRAGRFLGSPERRAGLDAVPHRVAVRRLLHAAHARRAAGASPATSTRRPAWTAPTGGRRSAGSRSRCSSPTLALTTILCVTGSLLAFEQFYILTKGGPDNSTITVVQLIYSVAFQGQNDLGVAAALSVIVLVALVVINVVQLRAFRGSDES